MMERVAVAGSSEGESLVCWRAWVTRGFRGDVFLGRVAKMPYKTGFTGFGDSPH